MRILPVLDVLGGQVVRGVGGRRREYRPIVSRLTASSTPLDVARAFADHFGLKELYLADLDALGGAAPALGTYAALQEAGFRLWVDAGVAEAARANLLREVGVATVVVGLETARPEVLGEVVGALGERVVFSLDLKGGVPLPGPGTWDRVDAWSVAEQALALGVRRLLVLDLARVGGGEGTGTETLCTRLAACYPEVEVSAGGGVRDRMDLLRLRSCGVQVVLAASALHDGRLRREDWQGL